MKQRDITDAARSQGKVIGHDGAALPDLDTMAPYDASEAERACPCKGTGRLNVYFGGVLMEVMDCPNGCG